MLKKIFYAALLCAPLTIQAAVGVKHLTVEGRQAPLGIDIEVPRFGWQITGDEKNVVQKKYHIIVCSSLAKAQSLQGDVWDSGEVKSDSSQWVSMKAAMTADGKLKPNTDYYWRVKIITNRGTSEWSEPQHWSTGMMGSNWAGCWIGTDSLFAGESMQKHSRVASRYLRKGFKLRGAVKRATVHICGLGLYKLQINGAKVGNAELAPLGTDFSKSLVYDTYDVTDMLAKDNVMLITLGAGNFFAMRQNYQTNVRTSYDLPRALMNLIVEYADGTTETIATDTSWKMNCNGPVRYSNYYDGEYYDASMSLGNVFSKTYDDGKWLEAEQVNAPGGELRGNVSPNMTVYRTDKPLKVWKAGDKRYLIDFGTNEAGRIKMNVGRLTSADTLKIKYAELLNKDGNTLYTKNLRSAQNLDTYIGRTAGSANTGETDRWTTEFTYHGFRYCEISGIDNLDGIDPVRELIADEMADANTDFNVEENGTPSLLNAIVANARNGVRSNYKGMPIDCPQRDERMPWLGDRTTGCLGESYLMDNRALYAKWMTDICESQRKDGNISDVAPAYWRLYTRNITWPAALPFGLDMLYRQYGDIRPMEKYYNNVKRFLAFMRKNFYEGGLITRDKYGDWCIPPESPKLIHSKDSTRTTDGILISSAYYSYLCRMMARYAEMFGERAGKDSAYLEDVKYFTSEADITDAALNKKYYSGGKYSNGTVTANLLPLAMNIADNSVSKTVEEDMINSIVNKNNKHISCGVIGIQWLMRYLSDSGNGSIAYEMATQTDYPGWGYMVKKGATTIWELWNGDTADPAMNSGNHVMLLGDLLPWCYENIGGIKPSKPGFKEIELRPDFSIGSITKAEASHPTPYGVVCSKWNRANGKIEWKVTVPANTKAVLHFPNGKTKRIGSGSYTYTF